MQSPLDSKLTQLQELLDTSKTVVVIVKDQPSLDQLAVASSLALGLKEMGKEVHFLSPSEIKSQKSTGPNEINLKKNLPQNTHNTPKTISSQVLEQLSGLENLSHKMGNQNLVVSFDYSETAVEKVSYHIGEESGKFFLTIKPQKGHPPLDPSQAEFTYTGMDADLVFLIGVHDLETLENLYFGHESFYGDVPLVTIHNFEPDIGLVKLDFSQSHCFAEALVGVIEGLQIPLTSKMATNLLLSIEEKTQGMTSINITAETFEVVAKLLRAGARRYKLFTPKTSSSTHVVGQVAGQKDGQKEGQKTASRPTKKMGRTQGKKKKSHVFERKSFPNSSNNSSSSKKKQNKKNKKVGGLSHKPSGFKV